MNRHVVHLTSVHSRYDTRIFVKMCTSLSENNFSVSLVVADGNANEVRNNVNIVDVGLSHHGRFSRMTKTVKKIYIKAKELDGDLYHLHDPELILLGVMLKIHGKKVVFDAHEDFPKQILSKPYLNPFFARIFSMIASFFEKVTLKSFDAIVAATPYIRDKFNKINKKVIDINNYPRVEEFHVEGALLQKLKQVIYVGGFSKARGICEQVKAMEVVEQGVCLSLIGKFNEDNLSKELITYKGWKRVCEKGWLDREGVKNSMLSSIAGLVTLHPAPNYLDSLPVKMFEYMAAGLPVIASNFPLWKSIIEKHKCGFCVDPLDPIAIGRAIQYMVDNPVVAECMGRKGQKAIKNEYNWSIEEKKLIKLYLEIL